MRKAIILLFVPLFVLSAVSIYAAEGKYANSLPIELTDEEMQRLDEIGINHIVTDAPEGVLRNCAEWEPSEGVIIRYPLGISVSLVAEMSEDVVVTTICASTYEENQARSAYQSGGVNMNNCQFIHAPTNSWWTRDYGPWFIFTDEEMAIVDHEYNRPRPYDDVIPQVIGTEWNMDVYGMDLTHTGGNHMSDGLGTSMSTELVYDENYWLSEAEVDSIMLAYLGNDYTVLDYVENYGIHHIDCWAKFLSPQTILVKDVPSSDPSYARLNARAQWLSMQVSAWGQPYNVVRVYCPSGTAYTNSLILNDKVLIPVFGSSWDDDAIQAYQDAMPGYEVIGFTGSWYSNDALHCRTMGVPDREMLFIKHVPLADQHGNYNGYFVETLIQDCSGAGLIDSGLKIIYSVDNGAWYEVLLSPATHQDIYYGYIPQQPDGSQIEYYIQAADYSGRTETHPFIGQPGAHSFEALPDTIPSSDVVVTMVPNNPPVTVARGGYFTYTGILENTTDDYQLTDVWVMLGLPGGAQYGPVQQFNNVWLNPGQTITVNNVRQDVPVYAPLGTYDYISYCGDYPSSKIDSSSFEFTVTNNVGGDADDWNLSGWDMPGDEIVPEVTSLIGSYPNPFNARTNISFEIANAGDVKVEIYNMLGQKMETVLDEYRSAGRHDVSWDASSYSSGVYLYKLTAEGKAFTGRMTLVK
ncbi:MAG: T9SS type A sorting domain-containing protein [candidate division Zixibacteria bacterium]|nr:T9SS type A sorting domain-containing protein [candidate division Zixibacteria bacterium]